MKLLKAMATVAGMTALSRVAGFVRDILTASILGAGPIADAFFVALKLPNFFRRVTAEGAFSVSFVPMYSGELEKEGEESANLFANRAFAIMLWGLSAITVAAIASMPLIINLIAPGFSDEPQRYSLAVEFSRVTFPYLLLMSLTSLLGGVLNAHNRFWPFAVAPLLFNLSLIGALLVSGQFENAGYAMSWGVAAAGVLQFLLLFLQARRIGFKLKIVAPRITPRIKRLFRLMGPGIVGAGVVQINLFADMVIGSFLPTGSISYLYYADRLNQLPLSTVGIAVGTALLPMLSRAVAAGNEKEAKHLFNRAMEVTLLLGLPAAAALLVAAGPIISVLFARGEFTETDAAITSMVLKGYAVGLPAYIAVKVFSTAFWSKQDTKTPVKISIVVTVLNIVLAVTLMQFLGVAGIAFATGIVGWVQLVMLYHALHTKKANSFDERFKKCAVGILVSTGVMTGVVILLQEMLEPMFATEGVGRVIALAILIAGGMMAYGMCAVLTGAVDMKEFKKYFKKGKKV